MLAFGLFLMSLIVEEGERERERNISITHIWPHRQIKGRIDDLHISAIFWYMNVDRSILLEEKG